jgi:hypothetical protein
MKSFVALAVAVVGVSARQFTVYNNCPFTIWPAVCSLFERSWPRRLTLLQMFTDLNVGTAVPSQTTGWAQNAYASVSFAVPNNWRAGRIWVSTSSPLR